MTPIQAAACRRAAGTDLIAQAKTGSGKTAAFALALLARLDARGFAVQAMVLCPTRELADQVTQEIRRLARAEENIKVLTLVRRRADAPANRQPGARRAHRGRHAGPHHGPPRARHPDLSALNTLVLDEADRMLDMGFFDDIATVAGSARRNARRCCSRPPTPKASPS
jgi:ATP-independent RNA helicase DbpA